MRSSTRTASAEQGACGRFISARVFCFVILLAFAALASAQTPVSPTTNTILFSGQTVNTVNTAPVGGIVLQGTAISAFTGQPVRHLWVGDSFAGPCRMDPEIDAPGPWDINLLTCTYNLNRAGAAIPFGGQFQYDAGRRFLYFVDNSSATQGAIRIGFNPDGDGGQGALDLTTAFTLAGGSGARRGPFLGGSGCPFLGTGTIPNGAALSPLGDLWISFLDSGDIIRFNSPATATEFGFSSCAQLEQLVATTPDGVSSSGLAFIGHDLWSGDGTSPFFIPNADTTCLVPPFAACSTANATVIPTLPQVGATNAISGDQFYPNVNGNNLYYGVGSQIAWIGNVAGGAAGQTFDLTYLTDPLPNPPLAAISAMAVDGTDPANLVAYSAEDPVIVVNPLALGNGRWWQTTQPINANGTPGAPLDVVAVAGDSQITLSWSPAQSAVPVTSYTVRNSFISAGAPIPDITVTPSPGALYPPTSVLIPGLINGVSYAFEVQASNNNKNSPFSAQSNIATPPGFGVPSAPTNVVAQPGDTQAFVTWTVSASNGGSPITSYTVSIIANGVPTGVTVTVPPPAFGSNTDSALVGGLANDGTLYTFTVHATNLAGDSPESAPSAAITTSPANTPTVSAAISGPTSVTAIPATLSYTITLTNTSSFPAENVNIAETLNTVPSNILSVSRDANGIVTVTTSAPATFSFNNQVAIAGVLDPSFNGTFLVTNTLSNTTFTYSQAGLGLPAAVSGSGTATLLPTANIVAVSSGVGTCTSGGPGVVTFSCNIGPMDPGAIVRMTFTVQMTQEQAITNSVTVSGSDFAGTLFTSSSATFTTNPPPPPPSNNGVITDLQITGSANKGSATVGSPDFYTWQIKDNKPTAAPNVVVTNNLPNTLAFSSVSTTLGTCSGPAPGTLGGKITCNIPSLGGAGAPNQFNVTVNVIVAAKGTILNTASVTFDGTDTNSGNNSATVKITGQ